MTRVPRTTNAVRVSAGLAELARGSEPVDDPVAVVHGHDGPVGSQVDAVDHPEAGPGGGVEGKFADQPERGALLGSRRQGDENEGNVLPPSPDWVARRPTGCEPRR